MLRQGSNTTAPSAQHLPQRETIDQAATPIDADLTRRVRDANAALARIENTTDEWLGIGSVFMDGRAEATRQANAPKGKRYNRCLNDWAARVSFNLDRISEGTRIALVHIAANRPAFDTWWSERTTNERQEWHHPLTLWRHFKRHRAAKTLPGSGHHPEPKKSRPTARDLTVELDMVKSQLAKARDGQLLIDLARDNDDSMTRILFQEPAVLTQPRRFAALFRRWAAKLEEQARRPQRPAPSEGARP